MTIPPSRRLPERPDLAQIRRQAKELRKAYTAGDPESLATVEAHYRDADPSDFALNRAQLVVARSYGFDSWSKLKAFVDGVNISRLVEAVRAGDLATSRAMLDRRPELANTDTAENNEYRAIHYAVLERAPEMVRLLMRHGADARQGIYPQRDATTALTLADDRGYDEIVAIITEEEEHRAANAAPPAADPDSGGQQADQTAALSSEPLADAVKQDRPDDLANLLGHGRDPDEPMQLEGLEEAVYSCGGPLWHCAVRGKYEMAQTLLDHGADPNAMVYAGGTPVFQAYGQLDWKMVELLERHGGRADAATFGYYRRTEQAAEMLAAADAGRLPADVSSLAELIEELLWSGACGGDPGIVSMALARTDWPADDGRWYRMLEQPLRLWNHMPSFWANEAFDRSTYLTCFELVLRRSDPNVVGRFGMVILHDLAGARQHVTEEDQVDFATLLVDAGASLDRRDDLLLSTPLGWACRWGRVELVRLLLERGADPIEEDAEPWATPRAWAEKRGHTAVRELLETSM